MAQSKTAPALDKAVQELHDHLVAVLGGERAVVKPGKPYWDTSSTELQDYFEERVDELLKTFSDQPAASPGTDSRSAAQQTGS